MTRNQIAYQQNLETQRSNLANESLRYKELQETGRHNVVTEAESERSNRARENETNRHNVQSEMLGMTQALEAQRHNIASEGISLSQVAETRRSNQAREYETYRSNVANEQLNLAKQRQDKMIAYDKMNNELISGSLERQTQRDISSKQLASNERIASSKNKTELAKTFVNLVGQTLSDVISSKSGIANKLIKLVK